jgi:hypothetical protein
MLKQSGIPVSDWVYSWIASYNLGGSIGYASQVISGQRSAYEVGTLGNSGPHVNTSVESLSDVPSQLF